MVSALENKGIEKLWDTIQEYCEKQKVREFVNEFCILSRMISGTLSPLRLLMNLKRGEKDNEGCGYGITLTWS